jgi:hypothetical protein
MPALRPRVLPSLDVAVSAIPGALSKAAPGLLLAMALAFGFGRLASPTRGRLLLVTVLFFGCFAAIGMALGATRDYLAGRPVRRIAHAWIEGSRLAVVTLGGSFALLLLDALYGYLVLSSDSDLFRQHLVVGGQLLALCATSLVIGVPAVLAVCERQRGAAAFARSLGTALRHPGRYVAILVFTVCGWLFWVSFPPLSLQPDDLGHTIGGLRCAANALVIGVALTMGIAYTLARYYPRLPDEDMTLEEDEKALLRAHRLRRVAFVLLFVAFWILFGLWIINPTDRLL